jgi:hypothetical protein
LSGKSGVFSASAENVTMYQKILDKGVFEKMKARAVKAGEDIKRDNARIERLELMRRGVIRGRRESDAPEQFDVADSATRSSWWLSECSPAVYLS